jgi:DHA2 family multidrug resistance protein
MQQAAMLSFIDVFHVLMIVVLLAMPLLLFMQGPQGGGETGRSARPRLGGE